MHQQYQAAQEELMEANANLEDANRKIAEATATSSSLLHALRITVRVCGWRMRDLADQKLWDEGLDI